MKEPTERVSLKDRLNGLGLYWLSQIVLKSCRISLMNGERLQSAFEDERPVIMAGWHGITMMVVPLIRQFYADLSSFVLLMPDDWRGMALRIWAEKLNATPFPMDLTGDNTMGMARKVLRLTRRVSGGMNLYINPDGPDGPAQVIKPGIAFIARKANAVIVPIGAYCRKAYVVPRWDRYTIPYPFSKVTFHIGEPILELPADDTEANKLITNVLNQVYLQAAADHYEQG